jgi:hypothetical protein
MLMGRIPDDETQQPLTPEHPPNPGASAPQVPPLEKARRSADHRRTAAGASPRAGTSRLKPRPPAHTYGSRPGLVL